MNEIAPADLSAEVDVVVVGSGGAGLCAALAAGVAAPRFRLPKQSLQQTQGGSSAGSARRVLDVGYVEVGPVDGQPVVLLHGWPHDIHSYAEVAPALGAAGYRVVVPYLRGYGTTRFLSGNTMRNGQQSALAVDVIDLMDALGSSRRSSQDSIGVLGRPTSSPRSGLTVARQWCR